MMFHEELRKSLDEMNCTQKELAEAGNLPASTVNRYVSGKRVPEQRSEQLEKILDGLQILSNRKKYTGFSRENFYKILEKQLEITSFDYERFRKNLNMLIDTLEIKVSKMTKELYYEPSYIQRIKAPCSARWTAARAAAPCGSSSLWQALPGSPSPLWAAGG